MDPEDHPQTQDVYSTKVARIPKPVFRYICALCMTEHTDICPKPWPEVERMLSGGRAPTGSG